MIHTERLIIEPLSLMTWPNEDETLKVVSWLNDQKTVRYSELRHRQHTVAEQEAYWKDIVSSRNKKYWIIKEIDGINAAPKSIGSMTGYIDEFNMVMNIGILIGPGSRRNRGVGREALSALLAYLPSMGIRKAEMGMMEKNEAMRRVAGYCGMKREGKINGHFLFENKPIAKLLFGKLL